jgi:hypothetical protein
MNWVLFWIKINQIPDSGFFRLHGLKKNLQSACIAAKTDYLCGPVKKPAGARARC